MPTSISGKTSVTLKAATAIRFTRYAQIDAKCAQWLERFAMGKRIREVEQGPDGAIWVLEDKQGGRLLRLTPLK